MFRRTRQLLNGDRDGRNPLTLFIVLVLMGSWAIWFFFAPLTVHEVSTRARVELSSAVQPVEAPVSGRVVAVPHLELGAEVVKGDVIVELDSSAQQLALAESEARQAALDLEVAAIDAERDVQLLAIALERKHGRHQLTDAALRRTVAALKAQQALVEAQRTNTLAASGFVSAAEAQRAATEANGLKAVDQAALNEAALVRTAARRSEVALRSRIAELERVRSARQGEALVERARADVLRHEIEERRIRANANGRVSEVASVHIGSFVALGTRIATILGPDSLRVVADFEPEGGLGRVSVGQLAQVHFVGFPAVEYGAMQTSVQTVATELRDGLVRVELAVRPEHVRVPVQHGLPASVSVEIEHVTAARLALRAVGVLLAPKRALQ